MAGKKRKSACRCCNSDKRESVVYTTTAVILYHICAQNTRGGVIRKAVN